VASVLLSVESASIAPSISNSVSITYSSTPSFTVSPTNSYSLSITTSISITNSYSNSLSISNSYSISNTNSLSISISGSLSYSHTISIPDCQVISLVDRCSSQATSACLFWTLNTACILPAIQSFYMCIKNSTLFEKCFPRNVAGREIPQFVATHDSTGGFISNDGGSYLFTLFQSVGGNKGTVGSNSIAKVFPAQNRVVQRVCGSTLCNVLMSRVPGTNTVSVSWKPGTEKYKRVLFYVTNALNPITFAPVSFPYRRPPYYVKTGKYQQVSSASVTCPPNCLCFVKLIIRYPTRIRLTTNKAAQIVMKKAFFL